MRLLNAKFNTQRPVDKCKQKVKYLVDKYKSAKDWNLKQSGGNRRDSLFYEEIDSVLGCRDMVTLQHLAEAGDRANDGDSKTADQGSVGRTERKCKRKQELKEEKDDEEERKLMRESFADMKAQRDDMKDFMQAFTRSQEQQSNTMNALLGALTNFINKQ